MGLTSLKIPICCNREMMKSEIRRGWKCYKCENFVSATVIEDIVIPLLKKYSILKLPKLRNEITFERE